MGTATLRPPRPTARRYDERGLAHSLEAALVLPVLLLVLLTAVQLGSYWHSRNAAVAAAQLTAELNRGYGAAVSTEDGYALLAGAGVLDPAIVVERGTAEVAVTVTGRAPTVIALTGVGGFEVAALMPRERLVP